LGVTPFVAAFSTLVLIGVAVAWLPVRTHRAPTPSAAHRQALGIRSSVAVAAGASVLLVSGWPIAAAVVTAGTYWLIGTWQARQGVADRGIARLDALASWIENVRDVLVAGEQPIGAIASTVGACSPLIRSKVRRLAIGLGRQDPDTAFRHFADELDDPIGDLVAAGLAIAIKRGARTSGVLTALAEQTRQQVDRWRLVEAERAPARREVRALSLIMGALVIGLLVLGRNQYLDAYDEPGGQLFLAAALAGYAALLARVQRLGDFPRPSRFLTTDAHGWAGR
jgi:hypothetical protein